MEADRLPDTIPCADLTGFTVFNECRARDGADALFEIVCRPPADFYCGTVRSPTFRAAC